MRNFVDTISRLSAPVDVPPNECVDRTRNHAGMIWWHSREVFWRCAFVPVLAVRYANPRGGKLSWAALIGPP